MDKKYALQMDFFASANGYGGFKSYFGEVFSSESFDRIFVLKGGPGTGKSTLIKKIAKALENEKLNAELFRCSSDTKSLDGVIIESHKAKIAVIDGTAPHERDAVIPGAIDVIVNLGESLDQNVLSDSRESILALNNKKKSCYKTAYDKLLKSSLFDINIKAEIGSVINNNAMEDAIERVLGLGFQVNSSACGTRLISSFSKNGYASLEKFRTSLSDFYTVRGEYGSELAYMSSLAERLEKNGVGFIKLISPLDSKSVEGIYFKNSNTAIICGDYDNVICDTRDFIDVKEKSAFYEKMKALDHCRSIYLSEAAEALKEASSYHFELEKLYSTAVDFEIVNAKTENILAQLSKIFI